MFTFSTASSNICCSMLFSVSNKPTAYEQLTNTSYTLLVWKLAIRKQMNVTYGRPAARCRFPDRRHGVNKWTKRPTRTRRTSYVRHGSTNDCNLLETNIVRLGFKIRYYSTGLRPNFGGACPAATRVVNIICVQKKTAVSQTEEKKKRSTTI